MLVARSQNTSPSGGEQGTENREQQEKPTPILSLERLNLFMGISPFPVPRSPFPLKITVSEFDLKIKSLTPEHLPEMVQLDKTCFNGLWTKSGYYRELTSPNSYFLGLFTPNFRSQLLGMGCFWSILEEAHITILAIHPQYHRQGLGQALLYSLLKMAGELGLSRATLEVRASNQGAISLYQKFGFKTAGRRPHYYQDNDEDALILWLSGLTEPSFSQILDQWYIMINHRLKQSSWSIN